MPDNPFEFGPEARGFERVENDSDAVYTGGRTQNATGQEYEVQLEAREGGGSFYAQKTKRAPDGKIVGKETIGRGRDTREAAVEAVETRARNTTGPNFSGFEIGDFVARNEQDITTARAAHLGRSERAIETDERRRAPVTTDASKYAKNPGQYDYPAVDTPTSSPNALPKDFKRGGTPKTTEPEQERSQQTPRKQPANSGADAFNLVTEDETIPASTVTSGPEGERVSDRKQAQQFIAAADVPASSEEVYKGTNRGSMVSGGLGGFAFDRNQDSFRETDRVEREQTPPESALQEQGSNGGNNNTLMTRIKDTREDIFEDSVSDEGNLNNTALGFSEFSSQVDEKREQLPLDDVGASLAVLDENDTGGSQGVETFQTTTDDLFTARREHEQRSEKAQRTDEAELAEITTDATEWSANKDKFDFPGVDTPSGYEPRF